MRITRTNVYAGLAGGYLLTDPASGVSNVPTALDASDVGMSLRERDKIRCRDRRRNGRPRDHPGPSRASSELHVARARHLHRATLIVRTRSRDHRPKRWVKGGGGPVDQRDEFLDLLPLIGTDRHEPLQRRRLEECASFVLPVRRIVRRREQIAEDP